MLYFKIKIILFLFFIPFLLSIDSVRFGAVLRKKKDAHLAAAITYAVEWNNRRIGFYPEIEYLIEYVEGNDYYNAAKKVCRMIEKQKVVTLFSTADRNMNLQIQDIAVKVDIPFFSTTNEFSSSTQTILKNNKQNGIWSTKIQMYPNEYLDEAISDLIKYWKWNRVIIVYSDARRINHLITYFENPSYSNIRFTLIRVIKNNFLEAAKQLKELEDCAFDEEKFCNEMNRVLVDMNSGDTYQFFIASLQLGLIDLHHWFLMTSLDLRNINMNLFKHNHARFIGINLIDKNFLLSHNNTFILNEFKDYIIREWINEGNDINQLELSEALLMFDAVYLATEAYKNISIENKLIINDKSITQCKTSTQLPKPYIYGKDIIDIITKNNIKGLTGDLSRIHTPMYDLINFTYRIDLLGYNGNIDDIGFWEPTQDVYINMTGDSKAQLQRNVKVSDELKPHFRVTTVLERPYVMYKKNHFELDKNLQFEGFCIDLLHQLSKDLGFTYTIHVVKDRKYGSDIYKNGTWDGIVGEILRGEADMAVSPFTVNFQRAQALDFTKPFLSLGISILYKIPTDHQPDLFSFLNPLSLEIWVCILLSIMVLTVGMYFVAQITPYEWNLNFSCCTAHQPHPGAQYSIENPPVVLTNNYSFWNTLWYVMSTMLKGGCDFGPRSFSTRLLGGTWWMFTLVIVSAYTANLAAVLTISRPYIPIKNLDDLANQTDISYGTLVGGSTSQFFMESKIESHVKMWEYMKNKDVFVSSNAAGVEKVMNENYAYLMESTSLEYEVQQNCNLTQIGGVLGSKGYGIALQKHSEWTDRMSRQILLYAKRGIIEMKKQKWWRNQGVPCTGVGSSVKQQRVSLTFHNVSGLFLILSAGLIISIFIVVIEFYIRSREIAKKENIPVKKQLAREISFALRLNNISEHRERKKNPRNTNKGSSGSSRENTYDIDMTGHI